jgi:predicted alpha/beta-hydrolase family hydrolase
VSDPLVYLAHGASGDAASMMPHVRGLEARGVAAQTVQLPKGNAERAMPVYLAAAPPQPNAIIGGHSFGGRVASLLAAEKEYGGLVLLSYPLHAPGAPDRWDERTAHWSRITCPVLLISGDHDQFARIELLRTAAKRLADAELVIYPGVRHGIGPKLEDALDRIAAFARRVTD